MSKQLSRWPVGRRLLFSLLCVALVLLFTWPCGGSAWTSLMRWQFVRSNAWGGVVWGYVCCCTRDNNNKRLSWYVFYFSCSFRTGTFSAMQPIFAAFPTDNLFRRKVIIWPILENTRSHGTEFIRTQWNFFTSIRVPCGPFICEVRIHLHDGKPFIRRLVVGDAGVHFIPYGTATGNDSRRNWSW